MQSFPVTGAKRKISDRGGGWPVWWRDGKELFFVSADRQIMSAALTDKTTFTFAPPKALFPASRGYLSGFSVTPDGERFLMNVLKEEKPASSVTVVMNWTEGLP